MKRLVLVFMLFAGIVYAAPDNSISTPHTFVANTTISSSDVNDNSNEVSNKYNAHTHTDITQLGTITSGVWSGTAITTQYGGTGKDLSAVAQGSILYFNGTGTLTSLTPGTSGQLLTTNGSAANPSWTGGGSAVRDAITKGFEASASVGHTAVWFYGGALFHNITGINVATTTVLTLATGADWASGSIVSYAGGAGWCYVGVTNTASETNKGVYLLGNNPPTASSSNGTSSGTSLYSYDGTKWYRVIGAFRVNTSDLVQYTQYQQKEKVMWDIPISITTATSVGAWSAALDCSASMPKISTIGIFGGISRHAGNESNLWIRPNGGTWAAGGGAEQDGISDASANYAAGRVESFTDGSQKIQYYNGAGDTATAIDQLGYILNIR